MLGLDVDTIGRTLGDHARRPAGHPFQARRQAVRRDRPGRGRRPAPIRTICARSIVRGQRRQHGALSQPGDDRGDGGAQGTQPFQQAALGDHHRDAGAGLYDGRGADLPGRRGRQCCRRRRRPTSTARAASSASSTGGLYVTFCLALAFIYLVLAAQFESCIDPFIIMLTVPLSMTGRAAGAEADRADA